MGVLGLGHIELNFDQLGKFGADRVDHGVQNVDSETRHALHVLFVENRLQLVEAGLGFGQHGLDAGDQFFLFFNQKRGFVGGPSLVNALTRILEVFAGFRPRDIAVAHFVRGVHDVDRIKIGNHLEVAQGHHPVFVHRAQPAHGVRHALEPHHAHHNRNQREQAHQKEKANVDA